MAAAVENDIEEFIRNQKAKLQQERQYISEEERDDDRLGRRQWDRPSEVNYANEREKPEGLPLTNDKSKSKQQQLREERQKEYNDFLKQKQSKTSYKTPRSNNIQKRSPYNGQKRENPKQNTTVLPDQNEADDNNNIPQHQKGGLRSSPRKPDMDYNETERQFQEQRRREYNEFLSRPKFKKAPTPPQSGMKFGEYEDFRKRVAQQRKEEYREELEKQTLEQAITKARGKLDISIPRNHQNPQAVSQEDVNRLSQEKQRRNIRDKMVEDKRIKEFERMLHMHHEDKLTDYMEEERNRILEDYPLREQDIQAMFQRQREEREKQKQNEEREREIQRKQFEFQRKLDDNYVRDSGDYGYQGRNAARSEPPVRRNDQYDAPRQQSEYVPPRRGDYSPPRQDYSPRRDENEGFTDRLHQRYEDERRQEYQNYVQKKEQDRGKGRRGEQPRNRSPDNFLSGLGKHQEEREKLNDERKKEYNHMLAEDLPRRDRPRDPPPEPEEPPPRSESYEASLHGLRSHESAEVRRKQTRNEEYNEFLKQKREQEKHRFDNKKYGENPRRVRDRPASEPQRRKVETRNKEYNEFLRNSQENLSRRGGGGGNKPPAGARRGWQSPGYEENRKRREEAQYRRDEPQAERRIRAYASDGAINRAGNDRRSNGDERDYGRRGRHRSDRNRDKGILDDDNWLTNRGEPEDEYQDLESDPPRQRGGPPPNRSPPVDREEMAKANYFATLPVGANDRDSANARKKARYREELQLQMREAEAARRREKVEELRVNASGLLDPEKTSRRLRYLGDPSPTPRRNVRSPEVKPYHTRFDLSPRGGQGNVPESSGGYTPRERGRPRERRQRDTSGILDIGFDGFLEQPRRGGASQIPPGLQYQPSLLDFTSLDRFADPSIEPTRTYVTGGGTGGVNQPYSSIDEAYHYYGMKNPLEPENNRKRNPYGAPPLDLGGGYDRPYQGRGTPRVTFDESSHKNSILKDDKRQKFEKKDEKIQTVDKKDETVQTIEITVPPPPTTARARDRSKERISPYQFPSDEDFRSRSQNDKRSYQEELDRQIEEKRRKKQLEKEEQLRYERKLDDEIRNYNPFGKGGGGAPLRDTKGNVVADLRGMHNTNQDPDTARSQVTRESPRFQAPTSPRDDLIGQPPPQIDAAGDVTHARGGHGIFGQPKTEQEKTTSDKYKDDLRRQIEEKKRREQIEKEKERMEEEKENRRLEEQRLRIQSEFEEEQRKKREKEDEARKRNEEMQQQAEARKKEAKRKKQEEDDQRMQEKREQENRERQERQEQRGSSPPVPALRTGDQKPDYSEAISNSSSSRQNHFRSESVRLGMGTPDSLGLKKPYGISTSEDTRKSPPIPALRRDTPPSESSKPPPQPLSRANSSDVLKELASMRKQLQSERKRVENALETQRNEPDVFDPRVVQRPPPKEIDVFERARQGEPAPVRADANPRNLQEFNELKYKNDTESRKAFRSMFPDAPTSNETLEAQQDALLRHQEDTLKSMKEQRFTPTNYNAWKGRRSDRSLGAPPMTTRQGTVSPRSMLNSNSAFIDVDGLNHFPDDFEDLPKRNESARYRRRERVALSPRVDSVGYNPPESQPLNPFGSTTSLDVDRIQRKNDARLRRLHNLNADEVSLADPDDILDRFMAKQRYNRPPSGQTLQDDTWLRPASKAI
ncbi:centrosome and spindle pole-associated protein 1-like isoform X33 [Ostrea edulis]|uniref:centrosome and spindle pole-associated protein 1-like isoform X33 n=1 Tax=Ostrea edulis TaxID=37623 RepID=UPI0024AFF17B|nr:centrosome and spindle pole-associated protein 1-like isoform X33 [Ostrea edulis]